MFSIEFCSENYTEYIIYLPNKKLGLKHLDIIRATYERPEIQSLASVPGLVKKYIEIPISESLARKSQHFNEEGNITVIVKKSALNNYCYIDLCYSTTTMTINLNTCYKINEEKILEDWEKAGFPLIWK